MFSLITFFLISHLISFICSILEAVILCCTNGYISLLQKQHKRTGDLLKELKERMDRPLAAILTVNTAAHTIGAAGVGAKAAELFGDAYLGLASAVLTFTMLFFTEMIPKTIGVLYWKRLAPHSVYIIKGMMLVALPIIALFESVARWMSRNKESEKITGEEIKSVLEEGIRAGVLQEAEHDMLESILRLSNRRVGVLMVPRMEIEWLERHGSQEEIRMQLHHSHHSRFPICDGSPNQVVGIVMTKDILHQILVEGKIELERIMHPPLFVPETMKAIQLLELFRTTLNQMALVLDEYGEVQGLVTLHDVLESIVGDFPSSDLPNNQIVQRKDGSWLVDGMIPIDEFKEEFHIFNLPDEDKGYYRTLSGFCMLQLDTIPNIGDTFVWDKLQFKVIKMDGRRIKRVLVSRIS